MFYSYNMFIKKGVNMAGYTTFINHLGEKDTFFDIYKKELQNNKHCLRCIAHCCRYYVGCLLLFIVLNLLKRVTLKELKK